MVARNDQCEKCGKCKLGVRYHEVHCLCLCPKCWDAEQTKEGAKRFRGRIPTTVLEGKVQE